MDDVDVVVVGAGAAGIAAGRRLVDASIRCLLIEARPRLGGRAWTVTDASGFAMDLGCGWLHSADRNPWVTVARELNVPIDTSLPSWARSSPAIGFPQADQNEFRRDMNEFFARLERVEERDGDLPASAYLDPTSQWKNLIVAVGTYISGAEFDRVSAKDLNRYADSHVNWRARGGLGALIASAGAHLPCMLDCQVTAIDHRGQRVKVETEKGTVIADQVIVTIPSTLLAAERLTFTPTLADKTAAARGLPLGLADKLFMSLDGANEFDSDIRVFGHTDRVGTGAYQFRPGGAPRIEAYFGGTCADELEGGSDGAFFDFAAGELTGVFGNAFAKRIKPIGLHRWGRDPFALGSYSFARPGQADARKVLTTPVDDRLFFAGEACSIEDYSTAHGAFLTGVAAAEQVIAMRRK
jgi:monoamine oxidase